MRNWEEEFNRVNPPESIVRSHRDGLRDKLRSAPGRIQARTKRSALLLCLLLVVALSGLTAAYPGWAEDFYQYVIVRNILIRTDDGIEMHIRTMQMECVPGDSLCQTMMSAMDLPENAKLMMLDPDDPLAQMMTIDAEICAEEGKGEIKKVIEIQSLDCGATWIVNGDTVESEEEILELRSKAELMSALTELREEQITMSSDEQLEVAADFVLHQNYPNPFNPKTSISFDLPESSPVSLRVFNLTGQNVATLVDGYTNSGHHAVTFDGNGLPSGAYLYTLQVGDYQMTKKMILMK